MGYVGPVSAGGKLNVEFTVSIAARGFFVAGVDVEVPGQVLFAPFGADGEDSGAVGVAV